MKAVPSGVGGRSGGRGSVPTGEQVHGAGAQTSTVPEVRTASGLERVVTGLVQVVERRRPLHVGAAWFWRSVPLQFLHQ